MAHAKAFYLLLEVSFHIFHPLLTLLLVYALISNSNLTFEVLTASISKDVVIGGSDELDP
jgi:hypothetical protein